LILGGVGTETWEPAPSPGNWASTRQDSSKEPMTSAVIEYVGFVRIDALPRILQILQWVHPRLTVI